MRVAVLGAGIMGHGIAQIAAVAGDDVSLRDTDDAALQRARASMEKSLARFVKKETLSKADAGAALERVAFTTELADAVAGAEVVVEAVPEILELKRELFSQVVSLAPHDALLGTNTSQLSITSIASALGQDAERLIGLHFFNPPVMMRLLEIIAGLQTSASTIRRAEEFGHHLSREVVVCRKDTPGFITSRAYAILRLECIHMLEEGLASAEEIDRAMRLGFNFPMGPLELGDMNGLDTYMHAITGLWEAHGERFRPTVGLRNMVAAGRIGRKAGAGFYEYDANGTRQVGPPGDEKGST